MCEGKTKRAASRRPCPREQIQQAEILQGHGELTTTIYPGMCCTSTNCFIQGQNTPPSQPPGALSVRHILSFSGSHRALSKRDTFCPSQVPTENSARETRSLPLRLPQSALQETCSLLPGHPWNISKRHVLSFLGPHGVLSKRHTFWAIKHIFTNVKEEKS